jgi:PTH1 family peptidyl-tRNA hydrolase
LDEIAREHGIRFRKDPTFHGWQSDWRIGGETVHLLKPFTFMNRSGRSVSAVARFYKIEPAEILVVHDDLDLLPGVVRLKRGGGHGGHNGVRDIVAQLGSADFYRLRLGIGHPGERSAVIGYVLGRPTADDAAAVQDAMSKVLSILPEMLIGDLAITVNKLHVSLQGKSN